MLRIRATGPDADGALCGLAPGPPVPVAGGGGGGLPGLREGPWFWLVLAGLALPSSVALRRVDMIAALVTSTLRSRATAEDGTALVEGYEPGGVYQAPHYIEGEVVPGRTAS